ncbi:MAG: hypothetical protein ACFFCS_09035 [Candidatus Hodarchaeota archaeon]
MKRNSAGNSGFRLRVCVRASAHDPTLRGQDDIWIPRVRDIQELQGSVQDRRGLRTWIDGCQ